MIWTKLQLVETLQYIAAPFAFFRPLGPSKDMVWRKGNIFRFKLRIFGFLPVGIHRIRIDSFDEQTYIVQSTERNRFVPVWKHKIILAGWGKAATYYTDEVEIGAGWKTGIVTIWSRLFYRHRQKKWRRLLMK